MAVDLPNVDKFLQPLLPALGVTGRILLGLYFLVFGLTKVGGFDATAAYMTDHGVPMVTLSLVITILLQIAGGAALMVGWRLRQAAIMLAGMTLLINVFMHDFWNAYENLNQQHETQNFIKNLAIMAGLLVLGAESGAQAFSIDRRKNSQSADH